MQTLAEFKAAQIAEEIANIPKQGFLIDAQTGVQTQQIANLVAEKMRTDAQSAQIAAEVLNVPKQGLLLDMQYQKGSSEIDLLDAQADKVSSEKLLVDREALNAIEQGKVLIAQECKLRAEFDVLVQTKLKTAGETQLLLWKTNTEKAQTTSLGVDEDSVVGKQKALYGAQATGFVRDAEQKAAKLMVDTWNVRRTTDEATVHDTVNMLNDAAVGRAVNKLLAGVNA